ncbi:MAG: TIGR03905 family TSCPD domain-containing protein [Muribaculaceae bacterium]|nr:TIGR03905 family TSCPD domain-containing protein [Muribaculaceae bacterium]
MTYRYTTQGTCSRIIEIDIIDGLIANVNFIGGCHGNLQGISALIRGMRPDDVIARLEGICCGSKATSCPDQLAKALKAIVAESK